MQIKWVAAMTGDITESQNYRKTSKRKMNGTLQERSSYRYRHPCQIHEGGKKKYGEETVISDAILCKMVEIY
jgi:hypothetical protein